jgi:diacylglycerol kinase (ATP)
MKFLRGFVHAFRGIFILILTERNFQVHLLALAVVVSAGVYFDIHANDWIILILTSSVVFGLEAVNTAIEKICNEITLERKLSIRAIKDIAAGAVLLASIGALIIGVLVFWKYIN